MDELSPRTQYLNTESNHNNSYKTPLMTEMEAKLNNESTSPKKQNATFTTDKNKLKKEINYYS